MIDPKKLAALKSYAHFKAGSLHVHASRESIRAELEAAGAPVWKQTAPVCLPSTSLTQEEWTLLLDLIKAEHAEHLDLLRSVNLAP